jgi:hypothetical protein
LEAIFQSAFVSLWCFSKRISAKQRKENAVFLGMESGWRINVSFDLSIRLLQHTGAEARCRLIAVNRQIFADFRAVIV